MKSRTLSLVIASIVVLFASWASAQECFGDWQGLPSGAGVTFSQITYSYSGSNGFPSGAGQITVNAQQLASYTGMSSGFINVVGDAGWLVIDLPVLQGLPTMSTTFSLSVANGTRVTDLEAFVCYSPDPVSQAPRYNNSLSYTDFSVGSTSYNADITGAPPPPLIGFTFPGGQTYFSCQNNHQNVQAANNQCVPASVANNFQWLQDTYNIGVPDMNIPGLRDAQNANSIVGHIDMDSWSCDGIAGRWADLSNGALSGRLDGHGVPAYYHLIGAMQYLSDNNIQLNLKHQGLSFGCFGFNFSGAQNYALGNEVSIGQGAVVQPDFIYNELAAGRAVEWWVAGGWGAHAEDIICAGRILGVPFVIRISDHLQTDQDPGDNQGTDSLDFSLLWQLNPNNPPTLATGLLSGSFVPVVITQGP